MKNLRAQIEAKGEELSNNHSLSEGDNGNAFESYRQGFASALDLLWPAIVELDKTDKYLEGISTGRELGTDANYAGENAKRYAWKIQQEIRTALRKIGGEHD